MIEMCSIYETKNILSAVLHLLILGEKKEKVYPFSGMNWASSLRLRDLPELYEYYMATLDMASCKKLPVPVLIYFQYDNHLQS